MCYSEKDYEKFLFDKLAKRSKDEAGSDIYSSVFGEISTQELIARKQIINNYLDEYRTKMSGTGFDDELDNAIKTLDKKICERKNNNK